MIQHCRERQSLILPDQYSFLAEEEDSKVMVDMPA
jgi:hypothetical protein